MQKAAGRALLEGQCQGPPRVGNRALPPLLWDKGIRDCGPQAFGGKCLQCPGEKGRQHALRGSVVLRPTHHVSLDSWALTSALSCLVSFMSHEGQKCDRIEAHILKIEDTKISL